YYRTPLQRQPALAPFAPHREMPGVEEAARTGLALPMSAVLDEAQTREVVDAVHGVLSGG
ncbi:MAG TPA: DegT/DnrJ/EryC1/StrS family aminotransferase, partial [Solirubrobacteraceae bacterium]|nr:DegT/DnrJ/EryC1/StrS family aminotransferase [Solirubrobacteraceae bacterium]